MPIRDHQEQTFGRTLVPGQTAPATPEGFVPGNFRPVLDAAFGLENDVLAWWDLATKPEFDPDPSFNNFEQTKNSEFWDNERDLFIGAQSQEHWDYIAGKIRKEQKQREILGAAGPAAAIGASLLAGLASPTMLIPGLTPLRGARGIAAAAALGGVAAAAQEVPLQLSQETRTWEEGLLSLSAGTILGGLIGGAAQLVGLPEAVGQVYRNVGARFEAEMDMVLERGSKAIPDSITAPRAPETPPAFIMRTVDEAVPAPLGRAVSTPSMQAVAMPLTVIRRDDLLQQFSDASGAYDMTAGSRWIAQQVDEALKNKQPVTITAEGKEIQITEVRNGTLYDAQGQRQGSAQILQPLPGDDARLTIGRNATDEDAIISQQGPLIRTPSANPAADADFVPQSAGAAAVPNPDPGTFKAGPGGKSIAWLGKISPVVQTIAQNTFPTARRMMATLSTAGLRLEGNAKFIPGKVGGTVEANVGLYDAYIAKLVRVVDEHYAAHMYDGPTQPAFPVTRATLRSTFRTTGQKMTREKFNEEVSRAMFSGDIHPDANVAKAAKLLRSEVYDPILDAAKAVGLFEEGDLFDDASYLARMYDKNKIDANPEVFVRKLTDHFQRLLEEDVAKASDRLKAQKKILDEFIEDAEADAATVEARRTEFQSRLEEMGETDEEVALTALRRERREIGKKKGTNRPYKELKADEERLAEIKEEIKTLEEGLGPRLEEKRGLQRRLRNLDRSFIAVEEKRQKKLDRVVRAEEQALNSLRSVLQKGKQIQRDLYKLDPKALQKQRDRLAERYYNLEEAIEKRRARLEEGGVELSGRPVEDGDEGWTLYGLKEQKEIDESLARMRQLYDESMEKWGISQDREVLAELLHDLGLEAQESINKLNLARGGRIERLRAQADKLTPEMVAERIAKKQERFRTREASVRERLRAAGVDDFDFETGNAAVAAVARKRAEDAVGTIGKYNNRVSGLHVLGEERGSELARVLSINSNEIFDFLVTDIERVTRNYVRQVAADIELKRAFGDVDAKQMFAELEEEFFEVQRKLKESGASEAEIDKVSKDYRNHVRNLTASISRLRHTWGIPENPDGFAARGGKVLLDLATLRFMGSVAISSIPDLNRLVVKHGSKRVFGDAFGGLVRDFKRFQISARELKLAGGALDPIIHSRAMAFADILDENIGHTMPERVIHTMATKMGLIGAFDYWTSGMKQMAGVLDVAKVMDSVDLVVNGGGKAKEVAEATEYLAELGFNADMARRVWDEVQAGGGNKVNGIWLPNTEDWTDPETVRVFRAAIRQANNNTIITPGLEIPLMANAGIGSRLLFQFKSFSLASHTKTLMAGLQQRDMALLEGVAFSLALGALSYYIWANTVGGRSYDEMMEADADRWLDEAIARSGLLGAFSEVQRIAERIPLTAPYANFSGEQTTRRAGSSITEAILGPSFDTLDTAAGVLAGIDDPTQSTVRQFGNLLPYNNVFYLRKLFEFAEEGIASDLPERRE